MFYDRFISLCDDKGVKPSRVASEAHINKGSVSFWKTKYQQGLDVEPTSSVLGKLSDYFNVSVDYLLGKTDIKNPVDQQSPEEVAKVALFGGDEEVTPEMWEEVKDYVEYIKKKYFKD